MPDTSGAAALQALDKLLAERPEKAGHDFSEATRSLAAYRDELIAVWHRTQSEADRQRLAQLSGVLSVVVGGQFPIGGVPWPQLEGTRAALAELLGSEPTS